MRMKTFYANSMAEALENVKAALGDDALILSTREIRRPSSGAAGRDAVAFEVLAATDAADAFARQGAVEETPAPATMYDRKSLNTNAIRALAASPAQARPRRRLLQGPPRQLGLASGSRPSPVHFSSQVAYELYCDLVASDLNEWLAYKLLTDAQPMNAGTKQPTRAVLLESVGGVARALVPDFESEPWRPSKRVIAFVGPTGVGKTTTLAKLAARLALEEERKVVVLSLDSYRIGAAEQLRTYAGLIGIPFRTVDGVAALPDAIAEQSHRDYILIDTTGHGPRDLEPIRDLLLYLRSAADIERHLVLSATTKELDMQEAVYAYGLCEPDRLLFTKLDETSSLGPILNELVRTQRPLSFFTDGQRVPEDLHTTTRDRLIGLVLGAH